MLNFKAIELQDAQAYMRHWKATMQRSSDYCFPILWGWAPSYGYQVALDDDLFWVRQTKPDIYDMVPVGDWQRDDWERLLREHYGNSSVFWLVPEAVVKIWQRQFTEALTVEEERGNWEYLYDIHALAELKGRKYMKKRNHLNQFRRDYDYTYSAITAENIAAVRDFQTRWLAESEGYLPGIKQEHNCILRILDSWGAVPHLRGGVIEISGKIVAYTIGEFSGDSLLVHFEKALQEFGAGYQVINQEFLQQMLAERPWLQIVNREEDLDDPGLREAKLSYHPTGFIKKYKVTVNF